MDDNLNKTQEEVNEEVEKLVSDVGVPFENTLTSSDYVGMFWGGTSVYAATSSFDGFVLKLAHGNDYKMAGSGIQSIVLMSNYPSVGATSTLSQRPVKNERFTAEEDCYALVTVSVSNSVVFTSYESGITKNISAITAEMLEMTGKIDEFGSPEKIYTLTSSDYVDMFWGGTSVSAATSSVNGFIVKLNKGFKYNAPSGSLSNVVFTSLPSVGTTQYIRSVRGIFTAEENENYLLISVYTSVGYYQLTRYQTGLFTLMGTDKEMFCGRRYPNQYAGMIWGGTSVVSSSSEYNGFYIEIPPHQTDVYLYNVSGGYSVAILASEPAVGNNDLVSGEKHINMGKLTRIIIPQNDNGLYVLVTVKVAMVDISEVYWILANEAFGAAVAGLKGKTILCIGDSITEFANSDGNNYPSYLSLLSGATVYGCGIGGTRLSRRAEIDPTNTVGAYAALDVVSLCEAICSGSFTQQIAAAEFLKTEVQDDNTQQINTLLNIDYSLLDCIVVMAGTNDWTSNAQVGYDTDGGDDTTIKGSIRKIVEYLCTRCPKARILLVAEPPRYYVQRDRSHWCDVYQNTNGDTLTDIINAIIESARFSHVPIVDLYDELGWNEFNFDTYYTYEATGIVDLTHPYSGLRYIAEMVMKYIKNFYY